MGSILGSHPTRHYIYPIICPRHMATPPIHMQKLAYERPPYCPLQESRTSHRTKLPSQQIHLVLYTINARDFNNKPQELTIPYWIFRCTYTHPPCQYLAKLRPDILLVPKIYKSFHSDICNLHGRST